MKVEDNLRKVLSDLPEGVQLAAVSKFHPDEVIMEAYNAGWRVFAENRPQEFVGKYERLPKDIEWHFIGHLQRNKVKDVVGRAVLIQSVDSLRLLEAVDAESTRRGIISDILLEVHVAAEVTKQGFTPDDVREMFASGVHGKYGSVRIKGLMAMASLTDDEDRIRRDFTAVRNLYDELAGAGFSVLSMGMSGDYRIAVECGSNLVRVGSGIFGPREY